MPTEPRTREDVAENMPARSALHEPYLILSHSEIKSKSSLILQWVQRGVSSDYASCSTVASARLQLESV